MTVPSLALRLKKAANDPALCRNLLKRLQCTLAGRPMRFMEVCGTHTVSIFQSGLRSMLPESITHLSGPGCPVCVTHDSEVELFLQLAKRENIIIATFGDLLRIPGKDGFSLKHAMAEGARIEIVYSPLDAIKLAKNHTGSKIVFLGVGFETTAPGAAAAILSAREEKIDNFYMLSFHKLVPPALQALLASQDNSIDAFLLPGHVATITGLVPFAFLAEAYHKPAVVGGFEPADLLLALCEMAGQLAAGKASVENAYPRAVNQHGNPRALRLLEEVFYPADALWRGLGRLPASGLAIRPDFAEFDAMEVFGLSLSETASRPGCMCGEILKGRISPAQCPLFGKKCTPATPVGPCMVSTEGSCAACYKYGVV